jgi:DMSO reductase anchor subunit
MGVSVVPSRARAGREPASRWPLLPPVGQTLWGWPAVANFVLGGLGAGLYVMAAVTGGFASSPALGHAAWLGPLLVLAGFGAVAAEAGRPLRGARVLVRVRSSWMSRELWLGGAFALLAGGGLLVEWRGGRVLAAAAGVALALAQGQILRGARGIAAWAVPPMPAVFLSSALLSGAGLLLVLEAWTSRPLERSLGAALAVLLVHVGVWSVFLRWSREEAFVGGVRPLRERSPAIVVGGALLPGVLAALAIALPRLAPLLAGLAGALMVGGQALTKAVLVLEAGQLRAISLPRERVQRRSP